MKSNSKVSLLSGKKIATMAEYGYRDLTVLKKSLRVIGYLCVGIVAIMLYLSIFIIFIYSVNSSSSTTSFGHFTLQWYFKITEHRMLSDAIFNTFLVSICATLISTFLGTLVAIGLHYSSKKFRKHTMLLNNIPLLNADIVTGISLMLIFSLLLKLFPYVFGFPTILVAHIYFTLPYVILNVLPKLSDIDPNLMDAALDLGIKPSKALFKVIFPAIRSGILSGMLMAFTMSFDDFVISYFTTGNGFDNLSIWIYGSIGRKDLTPAVYAFNSIVIFGAMLILIMANIISIRNAKRKKEYENKK